MTSIQLFTTVTHVTSKYSYGFGHIDLPWTDNQHRDLSYTHEPFNNPDDVERWQQSGYTHRDYTGNMYDMRNEWPEWFDMEPFQAEFNWQHLSWSFYQMTTGTILPEHVDTFKRFQELHKDHPGTIHRGLVLLEDWKPGHVLTIANEQMPQWKAGDCIWWEHDVPHLAANIGYDNRYTLQLTGFKNDST